MSPLRSRSNNDPGYDPGKLGERVKIINGVRDITVNALNDQLISVVARASRAVNQVTLRNEAVVNIFCEKVND